MTKKELFKIYSIDESDAEWDVKTDSWNSVEIYRFMHNGQLPLTGDESVLWITDFLDKLKDPEWWAKNVMSRDDWGGLSETAKRMVYALADEILEEKNDLARAKQTSPRSRRDGDDPKHLLGRLEQYAEIYQISFQFWGEGDNNVFVSKNDVDLHSSGGFDSPVEAMQEALEYLDRITRPKRP